jgi:undecaprenyl-diphosphatase
MEPAQVIDEVLTSDIVDDPTRSPALEPARAAATARRRRVWGKHASLAAITLGAVGGFLAITRTIQGPGGNAFDRAVVQAVGRARHPMSNALVRGVTFFGSVVAGVAISGTAIVAFRDRPRIAHQVIAGALGGISAELVIKRFFQRERPTLLAHLEKVKSTSFPSGHSMAAASLYLTLGFVGARSRRLRPHRAAIIASAATFASAIGATRVFLGVHWPTDVLGGLALGTAWACATEAVFDLTAARDLSPSSLARSPEIRNVATEA